MGHRSWFVGIKNSEHLAAVKKELVDVERREDCDWFFRMNSYILTEEPLVFGGEALGIRRPDGTFVYGLLSSDGSSWVGHCNRDILEAFQLLECLEARFQGRSAPIPGAQYLSENELLAFFEKTT